MTVTAPLDGSISVLSHHDLLVHCLGSIARVATEQYKTHFLVMASFAQVGLSSTGQQPHSFH